MTADDAYTREDQERDRRKRLRKDRRTASYGASADCPAYTGPWAKASLNKTDDPETIERCIDGHSRQCAEDDPDYPHLSRETITAIVRQMAAKCACCETAGIDALTKERWMTEIADVIELEASQRAAGFHRGPPGAAQAGGEIEADADPAIDPDAAARLQAQQQRYPARRKAGVQQRKQQAERRRKSIHDNRGKLEQIEAERQALSEQRQGQGER